MIIVAGYIDVDPKDREEFLASRQETITRSRREEGCIEYAFSADSSDASRVRVFEIWESASLLEAHLDRRTPAQKGGPVTSQRARELYRYEVGSAGPLRS